MGRHARARFASCSRAYLLRVKILRPVVPRRWQPVVPRRHDPLPQRGQRLKVRVAPLEHSLVHRARRALPPAEVIERDGHGAVGRIMLARQLVLEVLDEARELGVALLEQTRDRADRATGAAGTDAERAGEAAEGGCNQMGEGRRMSVTRARALCEPLPRTCCPA